MPQTRAELPRLVQEWSEGKQEAFDQLVDLLYDDLRGLAHRHLQRERPGHTLDTTSLVHEAYLELAATRGPDWQGRPHFFAFLSRVMRNLLVDYARRRNALKRGTDPVRIALTQGGLAIEPRTVEMLELDEALGRLAEKDPRLTTVVECRFFGGLTQTETAAALGVSERTVERDWRRARAYLHLLLSDDAEAD